MRRICQVFAICALLMLPLAGLITPAQAQDTTDLYLQPTDTQGNPVQGACFVLQDYSNEGCDENGDGRILFSDIPLG